jgi:hypothetical protein
LDTRHTTIVPSDQYVSSLDWPALVLGVALLVVIAGCGLYDLWISASSSPRATVSEIIRGWAQTFPPLLVAVGFLLGHLFWPAVRPPKV